ncbi:antibiotic biosynthesis monooxygenase [Paraflavitalea sp. CAU 1676]|uniref:putative quinol monooxygenase n=1 Tax=Paraflavitalea sp. CAU 1676 TaxID=3032598 RepID=UPI0023DA2DF9|nr:antibiotic biosynthesis monooxygenase [Paraflavitalea sp. CAU 1676]MDF2187922.1 antibiotic biosynthesis monooxygenase [Paraflavitalea sp. CAU 1676]
MTRYQVKAARQDEFMQVLRGYVSSSLLEAGNVMAAAYSEHGDPSVIWVVERWTNKEYYAKNGKSPAAQAVTLLARTGLSARVEKMYLKDLGLFSGSDVHRVAAGVENPLIIMLIVDVKRKEEDQFRLINHAAIATLGAEPGLLSFRFSQDCNRKGRFVIHKEFHDRQAFQSHLKNPGIAPVIRFLQHSVRKPPFEKKYHHLIELAPPDLRVNR